MPPPSHHRPLFIHIPKNAGTSIKHLIKHHPKLRLKYAPHKVDVKSIPNHTPTIVVLRDPIDRFCSAIRYSKTKWSHNPTVKHLIDLNLMDPPTIAEILATPDHQHYKKVTDYVYNKSKSHKIGSQPLKRIFTFAQQARWIHHPTYVILFENFQSEMEQLFQRLNLPPNLIIPQKNSTTKTSSLNPSPTATNPFSQKALDYLHKVYHQDFELLEHYRQIPLEQRLSN